MTTTRWWWIRHAPVVGHGGRIYGQDDHACDCSDEMTFSALAARLPSDPVWVVTQLQRTRLTAEAILAHRPPPPPRFQVEDALAEQHFGAWQGLTNAEVAANDAGAWHRFWLAPAEHAPPGGESFVHVVERVSDVVLRLCETHAGRDIVAVTHGGTIRAALALALGLAPEQALSFSINNCAVTRIDHIRGPAGSHDPEGEAAWRVGFVNHLLTGRQEDGMKW